MFIHRIVEDHLYFSTLPRLLETKPGCRQSFIVTPLFSGFRHVLDLSGENPQCARRTLDYGRSLRGGEALLGVHGFWLAVVTASGRHPLQPGGRDTITSLKAQ